MTTTHSYNTRNRSHLISTFQRTVLTQRPLLYSAPNVWNQIPTEIKTTSTLSKFKRILKAYLMNKYVNQVYSTTLYYLIQIEGKELLSYDSPD